MRNTIIFIIVLLALSSAIWGIFHLIFPVASVLMLCCTITGIAAAVTLSSGLIVASCHKSNTIKNIATAWSLNITTVALFAWTLLFAFGLGSYEDPGRILTALYVGYLIILIVGLILWLMADRGGSIAESHNTDVQTNIHERENWLNRMKQIKLSLEAIDTDARSPLNKSVTQNIDLLRNIPLQKIACNPTDDVLTACLQEMNEALVDSDLNSFELANNRLSNILKSLRL